MVKTGMLLLMLAGVAWAPRAPERGPAGDRIWARITTAGGGVVEGFVRWDRNEGSWADLLDGYRELPEEYRLEAQRLGAAERERSVEVFGVRVTWEEEPEWPGTAESGVRFGHVRRLTVVGEDRALLELRSGERVELSGGSTDLGPELRGVEVDDGRGGRVELTWSDLDTVEFGPAPPGRRPSAERLHGTVEDRRGHRYTGYLAWDLDEILTSDVLDGEEEGERRRIPFGDVAAVEPDGSRGSRVTLRDGRVIVLRGSDDVAGGNRGIQVADPALGQARVPWNAVRSVRFHPPERPATWSDFDGGLRLRGVVRTEEGTETAGTLRWDNDESWSWEILDGRRGDVDLDIELGRVARIEKRSPEGARVTLRDGRTLELEGSNDVNRDNKGIFVTPAGGETVMVSWRSLGEVVFDDPRRVP